MTTIIELIRYMTINYNEFACTLHTICISSNSHLLHLAYPYASAIMNIEIAYAYYLTKNIEQ